jgi:hypothetical protein
MMYNPSETSEHGKAEEAQWVRILSSGDPCQGMVLVLAQKMCTAFHEFAPAFRAHSLMESQLPFFRERLAKRIERVLFVMDNNSLSSNAGYADLKELCHLTRSAQTMNALAGLEEKIHSASHALADAFDKSQ